MPVGQRELTVLGEFKPFGLITETLDGKPSQNVSDKYDYFLFDPEVTREREEFDCSGSPASSGGCDHEIFIRGNRLMWITGSRVYKRFTLSSPIIMACWCRMAYTSEAVLCVLQVDSLTIFNISGELTSIPLPGIVTSIWPLPFGLLVQQAAEGNPPTYVPPSSSSPFLSARDISLPKRGVRSSPLQSCGFPIPYQSMKGNLALISSHLILTDPLEEPQPTFIDEKGELKIMKDFDERTIWTSDCVPLMASYNRDKAQHSLWVAESGNPCPGEEPQSHVVHNEVFPRQFSFRRIWQAKGSQSAATKVFLATDDDATPIICFLLQEQKQLLSVRLQTVEINEGVLFDIKPDVSWSIQAVAAEPVAVTRQRVKVGLLPFADIIVLDPENTMFLYSGKQCLCKFMLPSCLSDCLLEGTIDTPESRSVHKMKIIGLADAVGARINVVLSTGKMLRCVLRRSPSCSLVNDCITAMAEGLSSPFYNHFLQLLWGNCDFNYLKEGSSVASEWESFTRILMQLYGKHSSISHWNSAVSSSSWDFLLNSKFHKNYRDHDLFIEIGTGWLVDRQRTHLYSSNRDDIHSSEGVPNTKFLIECLDTLHAVYENLKLINLRRRDLELLVLLLGDIANFLGEESYIDHYIRDFPSLSKKIIRCRSSRSPRSPPSLYRWLESCLLLGFGQANSNDIPPLVRKVGSYAVNWSRKVITFYSLLSGARPMGRKLSSGVSCNIASGSSSTYEEQMVLAMVAEGFGLQQLDLLPVGVSLPLRHAVNKCRESPPTDWPAAAYILLGREDLALSRVADFKNSNEHETQNRHLISMSTPYMQHLQPVTIPSTVADMIWLDNVKFDNMDSSEDCTVDGMEHLFNSSTQLRYGRDLRLNEVRRLLCSARPVTIQTSVNATASDQDFQQAQLWQFAQRSTALPFGRGAFTLATTYTLLTEPLTVPKLVLAGRLPAQQNATVNLDPNIRNLQELRVWPEFHNAVAAGLRLTPFQGKISRTWIMYNKPEEPNASHAGLLLALGLHGHLTVLNITDIFQYYHQGHDSTAVGLMLGLAASYRGTMEPTMSKSFFVHLPANHPSSFPELEVPTLLQTAALMSLGLLYEGSAHPQTMQFLLAEIGHRSGGDNVLEREGYAVSAGFSLGLIALGRGEDKFACVDTLVDQLFHYAGRRFNVKTLSKPVTDEHSQRAGQILDGIPVNVDVTAPGAITALALMFLMTESEVIVSRLSIPQTNIELQYMRPDFIMLRVIARNLIMWSRINPYKEWIESQIPLFVKDCVENLGDDKNYMDEVDEEAAVQAYVNIIAGACISLGLKYAGSRNGCAQELLYSYAIYFLNEIKPVSGSTGCTFPRGLLKFVDRSTLEICLHLVVLSLALVMAGSGNLQTFRLLRFLRSRNSSDCQANFGIQMAVSLAIGFLFLGGGMRSFSTSKNAIAALLITLYPRFPTGPNDNRCHLQAYRHLYVLATEARWIQTVDVDTGLPVYAPLEITVKETEHCSETSFCEITPCILPERSILKTVRVCGPRYWPQVIEITPEDKPWWVSGDKNHPFNSGVLYIKRKVGACSYVDDPVGCQSLISRAMNKAFSVTSMRCYASNNTSNSNTSQVEQGFSRVDLLVSTFSSDPSLIAFSQLCSDSFWNSRSNMDFQEFCLQVLFECVSKDRPALLQVYMSLYTIIRSMTDQVTSDIVVFSNSLYISDLKLVVAYNEALLRGRLTSPRDGIVQSNFVGSLRKRIEELLRYPPEVKSDLHTYLVSGKWPDDKLGENRSILLSWYLHWFCVPALSVIRTAVERIRPKLKTSSVPLLRLMLPWTHVDAISEIEKLVFV